MKPTLEKLKMACPGVSDKFIDEYLNRLDNRYVSSFSERDLCHHLTSSSHLTPRSPVGELADVRRDGSLDCTVLTVD
jgi:hypothetical protein